MRAWSPAFCSDMSLFQVWLLQSVAGIQPHPAVSTWLSFPSFSVSKTLFGSYTPFAKDLEVDRTHSLSCDRASGSRVLERVDQAFATVQAALCQSILWFRAHCNCSHAVRLTHTSALPLKTRCEVASKHLGAGHVRTTHLHARRHTSYSSVISFMSIITARGLALNVTIPPNVVATVHVPSVSGKVIQDGVLVHGRKQSDSLIVEIGSGFWVFESFDN